MPVGLFVAASESINCSFLQPGILCLPGQLGSRAAREGISVPARSLGSLWDSWVPISWDWKFGSPWMRRVPKGLAPSGLSSLPISIPHAPFSPSIPAAAAGITLKRAPCPVVCRDLSPQDLCLWAEPCRVFPCPSAGQRFSSSQTVSLLTEMSPARVTQKLISQVTSPWCLLHVFLLFSILLCAAVTFLSPLPPQ